MRIKDRVEFVLRHGAHDGLSQVISAKQSILIFGVVEAIHHPLLPGGQGRPPRTSDQTTFTVTGDSSVGGRIGVTAASPAAASANSTGGWLAEETSVMLTTAPRSASGS